MKVIMKIVVSIFFTACFLTSLLRANELVVYFEDRHPDIIASCGESTYLIKDGELNEQFLIDKVIIDGRIQERGSIKAIFNSNVSFSDYFRMLGYLNRLGFKELNTYILSDDKKSMTMFEMSLNETREPVSQSGNSRTNRGGPED